MIDKFVIKMGKYKMAIFNIYLIIIKISNRKCKEINYLLVLGVEEWELYKIVQSIMNAWFFLKILLNFHWRHELSDSGIISSFNFIGSNYLTTHRFFN